MEWRVRLFRCHRRALSLISRWLLAGMVVGMLCSPYFECLQTHTHAHAHAYVNGRTRLCNRCVCAATPRNLWHRKCPAAFLHFSLSVVFASQIIANIFHLTPLPIIGNRRHNLCVVWSAHRARMHEKNIHFGTC